MDVFIVGGKNPFLDPGGYSSYAYALCSALQDAGYHPHLLVASSDHGEVGLRESSIGTVHTVFSPFARFKTAALPKLARSYADYLSTYWAVDQGRSDGENWLHCIGAWGYVGAILRKRRHVAPFKLVLSYFTISAHEGLWLAKGARVGDYGVINRFEYLGGYLLTLLQHQPKEKEGLRQADAVLVHYLSTRETLMQQFGTPPEKIHKIPYGIARYEKDVGANQRVLVDSGRSTADELLCTSICRQDPRKGLNFLLRAYKLLRQEGYQFRALIVGGGKLLPAHQRLATRLHIDDIVQFTGFVRSTDPYYAAADIFIQPSLQEGSGSIAVLEALSYGLPVITTAIDGIPEDITSEENGLLVPAEDPVALAAAIGRLLTDEPLRNRLSNAARTSFDSMATLSEMGQAMDQIYRDLAEVTT